MKQTAFEKLFLWNISPGSKEAKRYIQLVEKLLNTMEKTPQNDRERAGFLSYLQFADILPPGKIFLRRVLSVLIPRHAELASKLMCVEIAHHDTRRFSIETIVGWLDEWAANPYGGGLEHIPTVLKSLRQKNINVPKDKVIYYCKQLADRWMFRSMGNTLLDYKLQNDPAISDQEIYDWALRSAKMDDHGICRTWTMFLSRARHVKTHPNREWIKAMAKILHTAYISKRHDGDFIIEFLLLGAHSELRFRSYKSLIYQYRKILAATQSEMRQKMEKDLTVGNQKPRNYRRK